MTVGRGGGEISAVFRPFADVRPLQLKVTRARFIAPGSLTAGRFGLYHWDIPPLTDAAGAHYHRTFAESFYVLSGTVTFGDGERWMDAKTGDYLYVPERGIHAFRNSQEEPASILILFAPGAPREAYFEELAEISRSGRELGEEEWSELYARHDQVMVTWDG